MLPTAAVRRPAPRRIAGRICTVGVWPLVPVTASQGAASGPLSRQASSTSPQTGTSAAAAAANSGFFRFPTGAGARRPAPPGRGGAVPEAHGDAERLQLRGLRPGALVVAVVDDRDDGAEAVQHPGRRD